MAIRAPFAAPSVRRGQLPALVSDALFRWQARYLSLDAITGQTGALVRAATGTAVDRNGTSYTAAHSMPRWEARDRNGTGVRDTIGLRLAADDLTWAFNALPVAGTFYVEAAEVSTRTAGGGLLYLGNDAQSGARLKIDSTGTYYRSVLHNGTTSDTITLSSAIPTTDQAFRLAVQVQESTDGTQWRQRLLLDTLDDAGETVSDWGSYITKPTAWGSTCLMRANRAGSAGTQGSVWLRDIAYHPALLTLDQCARL